MIRVVVIIALAPLVLMGCSSFFPWSPSAEEYTAAQGETCNAVAMRQRIDAGYSGFDQATREKIFQQALSACDAWRNRSAGKVAEADAPQTALGGPSP